MYSIVQIEPPRHNLTRCSAFIPPALNLVMLAPRVARNIDFEDQSAKYGNKFEYPFTSLENQFRSLSKGEIFIAQLLSTNIDFVYTAYCAFFNNTSTF
jgi:hypothetical protein